MPRLRVSTLAIVTLCMVALGASAWNFGDRVPVTLAVRHGELKHHRRAIAGQYSPRFGIHTVTTIPAFHDEHARKGPANVSKTDFSVAPGTMIQLHFAPLKSQTAWIPLDRGIRDGKNVVIERLAHLTVIFTYRHGIFADVAAITYERRYAAHTKDLSVEYIWRAEKRSDPDRGIIVAYVLSFLFAVAVVVRITRRGRFAEVARVMVVRHRDD
jgi:hypothetical protein